MMKLSTILLLVALMSVTYISLEQNRTIINQTVTIRSMMDNPACRIAPVWTGKHRGEHTEMRIDPSTPVPLHRRYKVSTN